MKKQKLMSIVLSAVIMFSVVPCAGGVVNAAQTDEDVNDEQVVDETDDEDVEDTDTDEDTDDAEPTKGPLMPTGNPEVTPTSTPTPSPTPTIAPQVKIRNFVNRMYTQVLARTPEEQGAGFWTNSLYNYESTGAQVADQFVFSEEYINRNTSTRIFITTLYRTFFGRAVDEDGFAFWSSELDSGSMDRRAVADGFINSQEWADTCASYGIRSGTTVTPKTNIEPTDATYDFVKRMYVTALGRDFDEEGLNFWANELSNYRSNGETMGAFFFLSREMEAKHLSNKEFVTRLYKTFMNREPDQKGLNFWAGFLNSHPRQEAVFGFTRSDEFRAKCIQARILPFA